VDRVGTAGMTAEIDFVGHRLFLYGKLSATPSATKLQAVNTAAKKSTLATYNRTSFLGKSLKQNTVETSMVLSMIMSAMRDIFIIKLLKTKVYAITS
jgi:hypothetical protein